MAEVSENAAIFIATSYQAMERARLEIPPISDTVNLMVALVFLAFYLEENLDVIITRLNKDVDLRKFYNEKNGTKRFGLRDKFGWFYNSYIASPSLQKSDKSFKVNLEKNLEARFPGFEKIYKFRNPVSHGKIQYSLSIPEVFTLRENAKVITSELLEIVNRKEGVNIEKNIDYKDAIINFEKKHPSL